MSTADTATPQAQLNTLGCVSYPNNMNRTQKICYLSLKFNQFIAQNIVPRLAHPNECIDQLTLNITEMLAQVDNGTLLVAIKFRN